MADPAPAECSKAGIEELLEFWFAVDPADADAMREQNRRWFLSSPENDRELRARFAPLTRAAAAGELDELAGRARGRLGLILLLDQLPRNLYRGTAQAFAQDAKALELCLEGMREGHVNRLEPLERGFFCMPLQHAESREVQLVSVASFRALAAVDGPKPLAAALAGFADYAVAHQEIIERFGRFPHRNRVLGRESTAEEKEYLEAGGPSFGQ